jgi:hypothetical protein
MKRTRPRSALLDSNLQQDLQKLDVVHENTMYLVTHYVPERGLDAELRVHMRQLHEVSVDLIDKNATEEKKAVTARVLCAVCGNCCSYCAGYGLDSRRQELAANALYLFDEFLMPVEGTAQWQTDVQLQLVRHERGTTLVLVSACRQHTLEIWMFHNMESACLGFVYPWPTDFTDKCSAVLCHI